MFPFTDEEENTRVKLELKQLKNSLKNITEGDAGDTGDSLMSAFEKLREEIRQQNRKFAEERRKMEEEKQKREKEFNSELEKLRLEIQELKTEDRKVNERMRTMNHQFEEAIENKARKDQAYLYECGFQNSWSDSWSDITFDRLSFSSMSEGVTGGLDRDTGVFTAGHTGVWTVSYSVRSDITSHSSTESNKIFILFQN